jgi:hypothetical protein
MAPSHPSKHAKYVKHRNFKAERSPRSHHFKRGYGVHLVTNMAYIMGGTLDRYSLVADESTDTVLVFYVRRLSDRDRHGQCDACMHVHNPRNTTCSMFQGAETYASDVGQLYSTKARKPALSTFKRISSDCSDRGPVSREVWVEE